MQGFHCQLVELSWSKTDRQKSDKQTNQDRYITSTMEVTKAIQVQRRYADVVSHVHVQAGSKK